MFKLHGGWGDGMVWFWLLGLLASVLAGREAGLPQQLPGPGAALNPEGTKILYWDRADDAYNVTTLIMLMT